MEVRHTNSAHERSTTEIKDIARKEPILAAEGAVLFLEKLVASQPGNEGKWFAAGKDAGFYELAIELANRSPSDPRTLICAARDFAGKRPASTVLNQLSRYWMMFSHRWEAECR